MPAYLRLLLIPFAFLYAFAAWIRRQYFQRLGKRAKSPLHTIVIGNLAVGGSGKTPMALFVAEHINKPVAVLSKGYKRKTRGFREVSTGDDAIMTGDEPLEMKIAHPDLPVFVCENRLAGIAQIQQQYPEIQTVILDDAFQHLPLQANKYVLLTDYQKPFFQDWPMPAGRLREFGCTANEADMIVVTKCPADLDEKTANSIWQKLSPYGKPVFFFHYENTVPVNAAGEIWEYGKKVMVVSGLANNRAFLSWAEDKFEVKKQVGYSDHFSFTEKDYEYWYAELQKQSETIVLTTRKDFVRMVNLPNKLKRSIYATNAEPRILFQNENKFLDCLISTK